MGRLQTVVYRAPLEEWPKIRKTHLFNVFHPAAYMLPLFLFFFFQKKKEHHGIREGPERIIRLFGKDAGYFGSTSLSSPSSTCEVRCFSEGDLFDMTDFFQQI
jgi:hypothetical protein